MHILPHRPSRPLGQGGYPTHQVNIKTTTIRGQISLRISSYSHYVTCRKLLEFFLGTGHIGGCYAHRRALKHDSGNSHHGTKKSSRFFMLSYIFSELLEKMLCKFEGVV